MSRIVYLMGAGASRGRRITDNAQYKMEKDESNIIEGLPLVNEIPQRLEYHIQSFAKYAVPATLKNTIFPLGNVGGTGYEQAKDMLVKDLTWLKDESSRHATIDTFAKKLYLRGDKESFYKVELLLTIFFVLEQLINKPDSRYDTFLASILTKELELPDDISILTWNYDSQFEMAYREYTDNDFTYIHNKLFVYDVKTDKPEGDLTDPPRGIVKPTDSVAWHNQKAFSQHKILKLNGTANFKEMLPLTNHISADEEVLKQLINKYILYRHGEGYGYTRLSFAWDNNGYVNSFLDQKIERMVGEAETLVVIGYTFPFFNRETDRRVFEQMPNLSQIYIQDPNADNIIKNIIPVMSDHQKETNKLRIGNGIETITNVDQFFLPPEL